MCRRAACLTKCSKLLQTGHALASIEQLKKLGHGDRGIYPLLDVVVERAEQPFVECCAERHRPPRGRRQTCGTQLSCWPACLWADVRDGWNQPP